VVLVEHPAGGLSTAAQLVGVVGLAGQVGSSLNGSISVGEVVVNQNKVYPYLVPGLLNPDWEKITIPIGHGVYAMLFEDHEEEHGIVHSTVIPEALEAAGLTAAEAQRLALSNLERFAASEDGWRPSMKMIGQPGDPFHFILISDHPRAAAFLRLRSLYEQASRLLESAEICACVPQRESLIILPKRDRSYREKLVARLRKIEADARRPITFELFEVSREGVRPFVEAESEGRPE
jgi:hypothetical protein